MPLLPKGFRLVPVPRRRRTAAPPPHPRGTLTLRGFRPWGAVFALGLLLAADVALRLSLGGRVSQGIYPSVDVRTRVRALSEISAVSPVDVVFVGSSSAGTGIAPAVFDAACRKRGASTNSFNLGIGGTTMAGLQATLDRFFLPNLRPRLVYVCLTQNELNAARSAYVRQSNERFEIGARLTRAEEIAGRAMSHLALFDYRRDLTAWLRSGGRMDFAPAAPTTADGFTPREGVMRSRETYAYRLGRFAPDGRDVDALRSLATWCRSVGAECIIVELPMASVSRSVLTDAERDCLRATLERVAPSKSSCLSFAAEQFPDACFWDGLHLNIVGAIRLSRILALDAAQRLKPVDESHLKPGS